VLYHELRNTPSDYTYAMDLRLFSEHLDLYQQLLAEPHAGPDVPDAILPQITFDDGHLSDLTLAVPELQRRGLVARFFITAAWTGTRAGYMNWEQLRDLSQAGQHIGAHSLTHKLLTHCNDRELDEELVGSRRLLEDKLGIPVTTMSLPGGRANKRVLAACKAAGYTHVYTSAPRAEPTPLPTIIGRLNILGDMQVVALRKLFQPGSPALPSLERKARLKSVAQAALGDRLYAGLWSIVNRQERKTQDLGAQ
jgi:peptidoglycan/xylan/chitin deacetylase (PgdA/CDA1 family)